MKILKDLLTMYENVAHLQRETSSKVITRNILPKKIQQIAAADVSYAGNRAYCSVIVYDYLSSKIIESQNYSCLTDSYIPGFFMLREAKPILNTLKKLNCDFDLLLIDGHGRLHPRKCGLASFVGIKIDKPVIGIAKKLLCGKEVTNSKIEYAGEILGYVIKNRKPLFVSIGHKINLRTAKKITENLIFEGQWYPEPLRLADFKSKMYRKANKEI